MRAVYEELHVLNSNVSENVIKTKMHILRRQLKKSIKFRVGNENANT